MDGSAEQPTDAIVPEVLPAVMLPALRPLELDDFTISATGLIAKGTPTFESWAGIGQLLATMDCGIQFCVGDWLAYGEGTYGEKAAQIVDHGIFAEKTCGVYKWVAKQVPMENRQLLGRPLAFTHHMAVAELPAAEQRMWLEKAAGVNDAGITWSVSQLKEEIAAKTVGSTIRYILIVDCADEAARERLASRLESDGLQVKRTEATTKRPRKGPVTARKRRG